MPCTRPLTRKELERTANLAKLDAMLAWLAGDARRARQCEQAAAQLAPRKEWQR